MTQNELKNNTLIKNIIDLFYQSQQKISLDKTLSNLSIQTSWLRNLYYKNPINLLFSIDQFLYEFFIKNPQRRKISEYKLQIKEQKKLSFFYGYLSRKQLKKYFLESQSYHGEFSKNLIGLLERRLDIILYRSQFVKNIATARQFVIHEKVRVNNKVVSIPSYLVKPGDVISLEQKSHKNIIEDRLNFLKSQIAKQPLLSPFSEIQLQNWITKNSYYSKKQLELFATLLIQRIQNRTSIFSYQNPFLSMAKSSKYKYFNIYKSHKRSQIDSFREKHLIEQYRKLVRDVMSTFNTDPITRNILLLNIKKYSNRNLLNNNRVRNISMVGVKPLHLEISYKLLECIFLYSPQRIYYPFLINFDILQRAYLK